MCNWKAYKLLIAKLSMRVTYVIHLIELLAEVNEEREKAGL